MADEEPLMTPSSPSRRPVDLSALEEFAKRLKPREGIVRDDSRKKSVTSAKDTLVPVIQADVGRDVPVQVYRYRLLVPIAQIIIETAQEFRRIVVANEDDLDTIQETFVRHFGG